MYIEILPNLNVTIQSKQGGKALYEKIIVPFGTNHYQVFNMLDLSCRDIYHKTFSNPSEYLNSKRRIRKWEKMEYGDDDNMKTKYKDFFKFVAKNHHILKVMYTVSNYANEAFIYEEEGVPDEE
jgi:hypothetical protein